MSALLLALSAAPSGAQTTLFDNGVGTDGVTFCGGCVDWLMDFEVTGDVTLSGLDMWFNSNSTTGSLYWSILSSASGNPGSVLYSGSGVGALNGDDHPFFTSMSWGYSFDLGEVSLSGGNYWLQVTRVDGSGDFRGSTTTAYGQSVWIDWRNDGAGPAPHGSTYDIAFRLNGAEGVPGTVTPEPISMVLLGSGLAGVAGAARRRRKQHGMVMDA